jgi:nicotinamidase/pyrazinamidase
MKCRGATWTVSMQCPSDRYHLRLRSHDLTKRQNLLDMRQIRTKDIRTKHVPRLHHDIHDLTDCKLGLHIGVVDVSTPANIPPRNDMVTLLLIDVQRDFHPGGTLAIPTADTDAKRIATFLVEHSSRIKRVVATLDAHLKLHIAHPGFWVSGADGITHPEPFTAISSNDLVNGVWRPRSDLTIPRGTIDEAVFGSLENLSDPNGDLDLVKYCIEYTKRLEEKGKFQLVVWPEHCLIGSDGFSVVDEVNEALKQWSDQSGASVEWVLKGTNILTECYSALAAEVPVNEQTSFNGSLQSSLEDTETLLVCGQAMSHCVNYTLGDIVDHWPKDRLSQITLLTDCASSVPGFEAAGLAFQAKMAEAGVSLKVSTEVFQAP